MSFEIEIPGKKEEEKRKKTIPEKIIKLGEFRTTIANNFQRKIKNKIAENLMRKF